MKRTHSKVAALRKRIKAVQGRAKFVGIIYLLGALALLAAGVYFPILAGTCISDGSTLPVLTCYQPLVELVKGGEGFVANLNNAEIVLNAVVSLFYVFMVLALLFNVIRSFAKLGWLFKRRASYTNGFNRNMYAMDDMGKRYSGSLAAIVIFSLLTYLVVGGATISKYAYIVVGAGLVIHFFAGLIGGTVTLFTTGDTIEEEPREYGLFTYFVRNVIQIAAVGAIIYFLVPQSVLADGIQKVLAKEFTKDLLPAAIELVAWLCILVMIKHATAATEFNRDCMDGAGMKNFAVFSFLTALAIGGLIALPYLGVVAATELNMAYVYVAAIAFGAFLLDCIIKSRTSKIDYDDMGIEDYFRENADGMKYNSTII